MYLWGKLKPGKGTDLSIATCMVLCGDRACALPFCLPGLQAAGCTGPPALLEPIVCSAALLNYLHCLPGVTDPKA